MPSGDTPGVNVPVLAAPLGSVHVPPGCAVAPSSGKSAVAASLLHTASTASTPADGWALTFTVTVAVEFTQGGNDPTLYVYTPGGLMPGVNVVFAMGPPGPFQVPAGLGDPPRDAKRSIGAEAAHRFTVVFDPALCWMFKVKATSADALGQGAVPTTVYV